MNDYALIRKSIRWLAGRGVFNWMPDKPYIELKYWACMGKRLTLKNPQTYNEKLQWLKLYDRKPEYSIMVDKYEAKRYISERIGDKYIIPTLGIWERFDDIDFSKLPNQFVLKCTHDSGGLVICRDKTNFNCEIAKKKINKSLRKNYYLQSREWPYKNVKPRILAEQYMEDTATYELRDYKFFCFDGAVKALFIASDRQKEGIETKFDFYDVNFIHLPFTNGHPNADIPPLKPERYDEMILLAQKLSAGLPHLRVDFYEVNGNVFLGELTFSHWSGFQPFSPQEWDQVFGDWLKLPDE